MTMTTTHELSALSHRKQMNRSINERNKDSFLVHNTIHKTHQKKKMK